MEIVRIATVDGIKAVKGKPYGESLTLTTQGSIFTVTHNKSGYAIASFKNENHANLLATILKNSQCDWGFNGIEDMPDVNKAICHEIFLALRGFVHFHINK